MKTISFIGSDKNAGKTTAFNHVHKRLLETAVPVCITSIGINGEDADAYDNRQKPRIPVFRDGCFITAPERLKNMTGKYETMHSFFGPGFKKSYVMGKCLFDSTIVLEGPNSRDEVVWIKKKLEKMAEYGYWLIDGSVDRQFLAHPAISDEIYFALLISDRKEQVRKAGDLLFALSIPPCPGRVREFLEKRIGEDTKSLLFDSDQKIVHHGNEIPFLDRRLRNSCNDNLGKMSFLYLNGALPASLFSFLSPMKNLTVILDNFTLCLNVSVRRDFSRLFRPGLFLFHPASVKRIFVKQEKDLRLRIPENIPVCNLFRENPHIIQSKLK